MCTMISLSESGPEKGFRHTSVVFNHSTCSFESLKEGGIVVLEFSSRRVNSSGQVPSSSQTKDLAVSSFLRTFTSIPLLRVPLTESANELGTRC